MEPSEEITASLIIVSGLFLVLFTFAILLNWKFNRLKRKYKNVEVEWKGFRLRINVSDPKENT